MCDQVIEDGMNMFEQVLEVLYTCRKKQACSSNVRTTVPFV
jgi:hypothetical protein